MSIESSPEMNRATLAGLCERRADGGKEVGSPVFRGRPG
jgi:hypothetical protein